MRIKIGLAIRALLSVVIDGAAVVGASSTLWLNPGTVVTNGPFGAIGASFLILAVGFTLTLRLQRLPPERTGSVALRRGTSILQLLALATGFAIWQITDIYYVGWLLCFASTTVFVRSTWLVLVEVLGVPRLLTETRGPILRRRSGSVRRATVLLLDGVLGLVGILLTTAIHAWDGSILSPIIVFVSASHLLAMSIVGWMTRPDDENAHDSTPNPIGL